MSIADVQGRTAEQRAGAGTGGQWVPGTFGGDAERSQTVSEHRAADEWRLLDRRSGPERVRIQRVVRRGGFVEQQNRNRRHGQSVPQILHGEGEYCAIILCYKKKMYKYIYLFKKCIKK